MTDKMRHQAVTRLRALMDKAVPRKQALLKVRMELMARGLPHSEPSLYVWCKQFGVSLR